MINRLKKNIYFIMAGLLPLLTNVSFVNASDLVIVLNDSIAENAETLTQIDIKRIFLGKMHKFKGKTVKPVGLSEGNPEREHFLQDILKMTPTELKSYWIKESLKGGARPPKSMKSSRSLISYVKKKKGHIGYLNEEEAKTSGLTIIKFDK